MSENIKESVKKFWNDRPCNIRHSSKEFLSKEYFDEVEAKKYFVEPHIPSFAEFGKWSGKKVLEIGCGIGTDSINFARAGAILTVLEFSEKSLEVCKKRFEVYGLGENVKFLLGDVEKLDDILVFEDNKFDLIYSFGVIHHTPNPEKAFESISKFMSKGTELRVMLYSKISYKLFWAMIENRVESFGDAGNTIRKNAEAQFDCPVAFTYTFEEIDEMLSKYGIVVEKVWKDHIFTYDIEKYKQHIYEKDKYWKDADPKFLKQMEKELGWHTMVIAKIK